jgi:hypothetical protein
MTLGVERSLDRGVEVVDALKRRPARLARPNLERHQGRTV